MDHADACWPDEVASHCTASSAAGAVYCNDVSRLNSTAMDSVVQPRTLADVQDALADARARGVRMVCRGTKHSMGGQSLVAGGVALDMAYIRGVSYCAVDTVEGCAVVTVGAGATWADVIVHLNKYGKTPRTLQSYCSFSVGGTLSVNGHGITSDHCVSESVVRFTLVKADGSVVICTRGDALFGLALGGYGLFGVIFDVTLRVDDNKRLALDVLSLPAADLPHVYGALLDARDVEMKLARLDTTTLATVDVYVFRVESPTPTVSTLTVRPREQTVAGRLMYKWLAGPFREARFALEHELGVALDWTAVSERNEMLYESAAPLARLYSPLVAVDDTFVLQEFFIPRPRYAEFIAAAKPIIVDGINRETVLTLLNISVRFVREDLDTVLRYAQQDSFAFVLYYRLRRTPEADQRLRFYHGELLRVTEALGGTFYLPYRHHYTDAELSRIYPTLDMFCKARAIHDPSSLFSNVWADRFLPPTISPQPQAAPPQPDIPTPTTCALPQLLEEVRMRRSDSFRSLLADHKQRSGFFDGFLVDVFSLVATETVRRELARAAWDVRNVDDDAIYEALRTSLERVHSSPLSGLSRLWRGVSQVSAQKRELVRETVSVIARLGRIGTLHDYVSIGDHGKLVLPLRCALGIKGSAWVAHDVAAGEDDTAAVLERGAPRTEDVGCFVRVDYTDVRTALSALGDACADLVTLNQGLHHLVPSQIQSFLSGVRRVLRPGGIVILREHDLDDACGLLPMLDCAHMVFNAATGVPLTIERQELRGFRSVLAWRAIVEAAGFRDSRVYEAQPYDPTLCVMMAFIKPGSSTRAAVAPGALTLVNAPSGGVGNALQLALNALPGITIEAVSSLLNSSLASLPWLRTQVLIAAGIAPGAIPPESGTPAAALQNAARVLVACYLDPAVTMLQRFRPLEAAARPVDGVDLGLLFPPEALLLLPALRKRAAAGAPIETALLSIIDRILAAFTKEDVSSHAPALAPMPPASGAPSESDAVALLARVCAAVPALAEPFVLVGHVGLSPKAESLARAALASVVASSGSGGGDGLKIAAQWLVATVDARAWETLRPALLDVSTQCVPVHLSAVLAPGSVWNRAARAVLGCPGVRISALQAAMASGVGLGGVVTLWREAQSARREAASGAGGAAAMPLTASLQDAVDRVCPLREFSTTLPCDSAAALRGVQCVVSARLNIASATGLFPAQSHEVTSQVAALLDVRTGALDLSQLHLPALVVNGHSMPLIGKRTLAVRFRAAPSESRRDAGAGDAGAALALGRALASEGLLDGTSRASHGANNFYKVPEWLQVEIVQLFGASMTHTPWFRFPFGGILRAYCGVLVAETRVVAERHGGLLSAVMNEGFVTSAIPGVVMAALFAQLAALAYPLRLMLGDSNEAHEAGYVEQLLLAAPRGVAWGSVDARLSRAREVGDGLWVVSVPTFKPLTDVLQRLASALPAAQLLLVSNHAVCQVRLLADDADAARRAVQVAALAAAATLPGCARLFEFELPHVGGPVPPAQQLALAVDVSALLALLRVCGARGVGVHVLDFN